MRKANLLKWSLNNVLENIKWQKHQDATHKLADTQQIGNLIYREIWKQENLKGWISYELHEDIAQILVAARNHLRFFQPGPNSSTHTSNLKVADEFLEEAILKIQLLYEKLGTPPIQLLGLQGCICDLIEKENGLLGTELYFQNHAKQVEQLEDPFKLILYRIIHEIVVNIHKHAKAKNAWISIAEDNNDIILDVRDNGVGFYNTERLWRNGLHSIKTIVNMLDGQMKISSAPGRGCQFWATIPTTNNRSTMFQN